MKSIDSLNFLIVDDDQLLREVLVDYLQYLGAHVAEAENGIKAFQMVLNEKFDIVISDVRMPGGNGIELAEKIDSLKIEKPLFFMCSGYSDELPVEKIKQLNIINIFDKPFNTQELVEDVLKNFEKYTQR